MKDFLESEGFLVNSPRETLKQAYQIGVLQNGHLWLEALEDRNLTAHLYDEATSLKVLRLIREKYFSLLKEFFESFKTKA